MWKAEIKDYLEDTNTPFDQKVNNVLFVYISILECLHAFILHRYLIPLAVGRYVDLSTWHR